MTEEDKERAELTRAMRPVSEVIGGRPFVLLYNDAAGGTGILSNIDDVDDLKRVIVGVAGMVLTREHDRATTVGPDGETRRA